VQQKGLLFDHLVGATEQRDWKVIPSTFTVLRLMARWGHVNPGRRCADQ